MKDGIDWSAAGAQTVSLPSYHHKGFRRFLMSPVVKLQLVSVPARECSLVERLHVCAVYM